MTPEDLTTSTAIADWLRTRMRKGEGLTAPYARRWDVGGRTATRSLRDSGADQFSILGSGLLALKLTVYGISDELLIELPNAPVWISADRSIPGEGLPEAFMIRLDSGGPPQYVGNSAEVITELIRKLTEPVPNPTDDRRVQVGFPGYDGEPKYVGSWEWGIHGEARGEEFVRRAAAATLAAIEERSAQE